MNVGDVGAFREDAAHPWTLVSGYNGRWQLTEYDAARGVWTAEHLDGAGGVSFFTLEEMHDLWIPELENLGPAEDPSTCACPARLLVSVGHKPNCKHFNSYRKSKEPWRY